MNHSHFLSNRSNILSLLFIALLPICTACIQAPLPKQAGYYTIEHVNVIPMTGPGVLADYTVVIQDGIILSVAPSGSSVIDPASEHIDATGQYMIPGLSDMHGHIQVKTDGYLWVAKGVTLIRETAGSPLKLSWREDFRTHKSFGPEMFTASPIMDGADAFYPWNLRVATPEQARELVQAFAEEGYDGIKVYSNLAPEVFAEINAAAQEFNIPVWGHIPMDVGVLDAVNSGMQSVEHLSEYVARPDIIEYWRPGNPVDYSVLEDFDAVIEATVANGVYNCPTLVVWDRTDRVDELLAGDQSIRRYVSPAATLSWAFFERLLEDIVDGTQHAGLYYEALNRLYAGGAKLLIGTDTGSFYVVPGFSVHDEMRLFVEEAGIPPWDVLKSATVNAAEMLGIDDRLGTIEEGKEADLVLLNSNPLENIQATQDIAAVVMDGALYDSDELEAMLEYIAQLYTGGVEVLPSIGLR